MSNIDKQALRINAQLASSGKWIKESGDGWEAICSSDDQANSGFIIAHFEGPDAKENREFIQAANPATVLALLDELSESQAGKANESSCADSTINLAIKWQMQCKAAEERVAELTEFVQHVKKCLVKNGEYAPLSYETIDTILGIRADGTGE